MFYLQFVKYVFTTILVIIFIVGCSTTNTTNTKNTTNTASGQDESTAKNTVEVYLKLMESGKVEEASKHLDTDENLIDVFNYEYLDTLNEEDLNKEFFVTKEIYEGDNNEETQLEKDYGTWEEYQQYVNKNFGDKEKFETKINEDSVFIKELDSYKSYVFLYDMEIANNYGEKLYEKVEFSTEWDTTLQKFYITKIYIR